jgi:4,5-dihydroxyphthalate decarboxylase
MADISLTLAIGEYDHVRDLTGGPVRATGIDLTWLALGVEEIFHRFPAFREWDVSEMSLGRYVALVSRDDPGLTAIPVFVSRMFRHSAFYVRRGGGIRTPRDLVNRRVGIPEWLQTAGIYGRGMLAHQYGVPLHLVEWHQAGLDEPGRAETVDADVPDGVRLVRRPDRSLTQMLLSGEVDCVLSARPPAAFVSGDSRLARLFPEFPVVEQDYHRATGIFPAMHLIAIRREIVERHPWVPLNLMKAFEKARDRSIARLRDMTASYYPVPWIQEITREVHALSGDDPWPYGIEANRATLQAFLRYCHEQGVARRLLRPEELFPRPVRSMRSRI